MRLLIDEMYPPTVAKELRKRGHDVVAVSEKKEWRSLDDAAIFEKASLERRAIVTENIGDFVALAEMAEQRGREHYGLILLDPEKYPRGRNRTVGAMVNKLDAILTESSDDKPRSIRVWL